MKKVIAILAIMVVLVGVVFAAQGNTETYTIRLKTKVTGDDPIFTLSAVESSKNANASTNSNAAFENGGSASATLSVIDLSKDDVLVTFASELVNQAKSEASFTITFVPGPFAVKRYVGNEKVDAKIYPSNVEAGSGNNTGAVTGYALSAYDCGVSTSDSSQIEYTSVITFNKALSTAGVLTTYSVKYAKDAALVESADVNPNDPFYYADCKMTVTMN